SRLIELCSVIFFFQAEDGIRDRTVTGVQTCALPICTAEVDDDLLPALADHLEQLLLELGRRVEVDLAGQRDHVGVSAQLLRLDRSEERRVGKECRVWRWAEE